MTDQPNPYAIRGGVSGRERLRLLGRVMAPATLALFDRLGVRDGMSCLDFGCGGGDASLALARRVAPSGRVIGIDNDPVTLEIARDEARAAGIDNVEYRAGDVLTFDPLAPFDVVYARFLLTHLRDPDAAARTFVGAVRPGGWFVVEDIDFSGHVTWPDCPAARRYVELYCAVVTRRGGDPNIGPRLPALLKDVGLEAIAVNVVQPAALDGEAKLVNPITMENIADAVVHDGLATREEVEEIVRDLYAFAKDPTTLVTTARIVQTWGRRT